MRSNAFSLLCDFYSYNLNSYSDCSIDSSIFLICSYFCLRTTYMPILCIFSLLIRSMNLLALFKAESYAWMISLAFVKGRWTEAPT